MCFFVKIFAFVKVFHYISSSNRTQLNKIGLCLLNGSMWGGSRKICDFHIVCKLFLYCIVDTTHFCLTPKRIIIRQISILFPKCSNNAAPRKQKDLVTDCHGLVLPSWCC